MHDPSVSLWDLRTIPHMVQVDKRSHLVLFKQNQRNHDPYTSELQKAYKTDYIVNRHNMMGTVSKLYVSNNTWIYVYINFFTKFQLQFQLPRVSTPIPTPTPGVSTPTPTPTSLLNINSNSNSNSGSFNSNSNSNSGQSPEYQLQLQLRRFQLQFQLQLRSWPQPWFQVWSTFYLCTYRKISNIRCTKSPNLIVSRLVLQLSLPNPMKPGVKSRLKI